MNSKLLRNFFNACHALYVVISYITGFPSDKVFYGSMLYFICDTLYEIWGLYLRKFNVKIYEFGMITHHCVSMLSMLLLLQKGPIADMVYYFYYILELSNLPMYIVYHLKQIKYTNEVIINTLLISEVLWYIYYRLYLGVSKCYEYFETENSSDDQILYGRIGDA